MMENLVFYSSLAYNVMLNKLNFRPWFNRIDDSVILGALPFRGRFSRMLIEQEGVRAVISMNHDFELEKFTPSSDEWRQLGAEFLQLPTRDFVEAPSLDNIRRGVELIEKYTSSSNDRNGNDVNDGFGNNDPCSSVYIHCKAGRTRSATLVACYLVKRQNITVQEAINIIRSKRPHIYLAEVHLRVIQEFYHSLKA